MKTKVPCYESSRPKGSVRGGEWGLLECPASASCGGGHVPPTLSAVMTARKPAGLGRTWRSGLHTRLLSSPGPFNISLDLWDLQLSWAPAAGLKVRPPECFPLINRVVQKEEGNKTPNAWGISGRSNQSDSSWPQTELFSYSPFFNISTSIYLTDLKKTPTFWNFQYWKMVKHYSVRLQLKYSISFVRKIWDEYLYPLL